MCLPPIQSLIRSNPVFTQTRTVVVTHSVAKGLPPAAHSWVRADPWVRPWTSLGGGSASGGVWVGGGGKKEAGSGQEGGRKDAGRRQEGDWKKVGREEHLRYTDNAANT
jgi:hypothetical protein